jgi:LEA14-like dessication related protein
MRLILVLLLFALPISCVLFRKNIEKPVVKLSQVDVREATPLGATLDFAVSVQNPNDFALKVDGVKYDV